MNDALATTQQALRLVHARKFLRIARHFLNDGADESAIESLILARELNPGDPAVLTALGDAYNRLDRPDEARALWTGLLETASRDDITRFRIVSKLVLDASLRDANEEAIDCLFAYLHKDPSDRVTAAYLLFLRVNAAPPAQQRDVVERYRSVFGYDPMADLVLAISRGLYDEPNEAVERIVAAPALYDGHPEIALAALDALGEVAPPATVLAFAEALEGSFAGDGRFVRRLMRAMAAAGIDKHTIARTADRIPLDGRRGSLRKLRLLVETRCWAHVVEQAETLLASKPFDADIAALAIRGCVILERLEDADRLLARCKTALGGAGPDEQVELARLEILAKRPDVAAARLAPLYRLQSSRIAARADLAQATALVGDYQAARPILADALDNTVGQLPVRRLAARCYAAMDIVRDPDSRFPGALIEHALRQEPKRVVSADLFAICTSTLAAGGAERQVALTASHVADRHGAEGGRTVLLGRNLDQRRGNGVMLGLATRSAHLEIEDLWRLDAPTVFRTLCAQPDADRGALKLIAAFPEELSGDIVKLYARFTALRPRVVHLWQDGRITLGAVAAVLAGVPRIVGSVRNVTPPPTDRRRYRPYLAAVYRALGARADVTLTANSQAGASDYESAYGLLPGSIRVLRNGIDVDKIRAGAPEDAVGAVRAKFGLTGGGPLVGGVFRLAPAKRPDLWLETAARTARARPDARFVIIGTGVLREQLERQAAALGLGEALVFAGPQSPIEPWIAAMDAMLLVSEVEGLPNVVLEAQALGVPVVATNAGGTAEAILDGHTGRLVMSETPDALADAVVEVLGGAIADLACRDAPAFIAARFGVPRMIDETLAAYAG